MVDLKEKNSELTKTVELSATKDQSLPKSTETAGEQKTTSPALPAAAPHKISKGEKFYNWVVYSGINYWVNLIGSLAIADLVNNGKGRKGMDFAIGKMAKFIEKTGVSLKTAHHNSRVAFETAALTSGGWILLWPMKYLEDRKRKAVYRLNEMMGVDQTAPDGHKLTPDEIYIEKAQPPQGWGRVIWRRILASSSVVVVGQALEHLAADKSVSVEKTYHINPFDPKSETITEKSYLGGKKRATDFITGWVKKGIGLLPGGEKIMKPAWVGRWMELAALDTFFTKITAFVMRITNGAKKEETPNTVIESGDQANIASADLPVSSQKPVLENFKKEPLDKEKLRTDRRTIMNTAQLSHAQKIAAEPAETLQTSV